MLTSIIAFFVGLFSLGGTTFGAAPALTVQQGGTGTSSVPANYVLLGSTAGRLTAVSTSSLGIIATGDGAFSTTSANHWSTFGLAFSTTSTDYWKTQNTFEAITAGDALTRTADDIDFDGGTIPAGALGGTWASPTVDDDSHAHTATTISGLGTADISGLDISDDTNLAATYPAILTGDTLSLGFSTTTDNTWSGLQTFTNAGTSTFSGHVQVTGNLRVDGAFYAPVTIVSSGNTTINGTLNVTGQTTLATSLTGILKGTSGVVSVASAGTDYENPLTFTYPLQRTTNTISLGFGTTTANSWSALQSFSNATSTLFTSTTAWIDRLTLTNASTTNLTVNLTQVIGDGSGASLITPTRGLTVPFGATTTAWTGTTTIRVGPAPFGFTINTAWCETNTGTLNVKLVHGATNMQMVKASSTIGQQTVSTNNAITKGTLITIDVGTPASTPTNGSCTFSGPQTSQ